MTRAAADAQSRLGKMGYKFQFVTLAGFHSLNYGMFTLAAGYKKRGMSAYAELQEAEFASEAAGYTATKHQREVGSVAVDPCKGHGVAHFGGQLCVCTAHVAQPVYLCSDLRGPNVSASCREQLLTCVS